MFIHSYEKDLYISVIFLHKTYFHMKNYVLCKCRKHLIANIMLRFTGFYTPLKESFSIAIIKISINLRNPFKRKNITGLCVLKPFKKNLKKIPQFFVNILCPLKVQVSTKIKLKQMVLHSKILFLTSECAS